MLPKIWGGNCVVKAGEGQHIALYEQLNKSLRKLRSLIPKVDKRSGSASHLPSLVCFGPLKEILFALKGHSEWSIIDILMLKVIK